MELTRTRMFIAELASSEQGAATAEYAIATMAAVGLAGVLVALLKGDLVRSLLEGIIKSAFHVGG